MKHWSGSEMLNDWEPRFWEKVMPEPMSGCWLWTACTNSDGYGAFTHTRKSHHSHRVSYELLVGAVPDGLQLDHLCRTRACVNPAHLEPVTCKENVLRGAGPSAEARRKTHCKQGHLLSGDNLRPCELRRGERGCSVCANERHRRWAAKKRVLLNVGAGSDKAVGEQLDTVAGLLCAARDGG